MSIDTQFESLKEWAHQKKIILIEGDYQQNKSPIVKIPNREINSIENFKNLIENLNIKAIIYEILHFDTVTFNLYEKTVKEIDEIETQQKFEQLRQFENKTLGYTLIIFSEGMSFQFDNYSDVTSIYLDIQSDVFDYIEDNNAENSKYKEIPQEKIIELGKQLAEHENYSKLKSRIQRENFSREFFKSDFERLNISDYYGANVIVSYAETFYETKIKPQKQKELKLKITELINKGWTKVKIAAELSISKDTLNKYV